MWGLGEADYGCGGGGGGGIEGQIKVRRLKRVLTCFWELL